MIGRPRGELPSPASCWQESSSARRQVRQPPVPLASTPLGPSPPKGPAVQNHSGTIDFGASGPSTSIQFIKTRVDEDTKATTTITFASPVLANVLGFAVSDIGVDELVVAGTRADGSAVTGDQLAGTTFNFCDAAEPKPDNCDGRLALRPGSATARAVGQYARSRDAVGDHCAHDRSLLCHRPSRDRSDSFASLGREQFVGHRTGHRRSDRCTDRHRHSHRVPRATTELHRHAPRWVSDGRRSPVHSQNG